MCRHLSSLLGQSPQTHLHLTPEPRPAGRLPTTLPECPSSFPGAQGALNRTQWGVSERGYAGPHPPFVPNRPVYLAHVQTPRALLRVLHVPPGRGSRQPRNPGLGVRVVGGGPPAAPVAAPHSRGRSSSRKRPVSRTGFPNDPCAPLAGRRPAVTSPRGQFARLIWT